MRDDDRIPMLDLGAQNEPLLPAIREAFERVMRSSAFVLGAEVEAFEREVAALLGVRHALGCSSGTDAELLALMALGVGPGDEVITTAFTFFATAGGIARLGARPVFVDVDPRTLNLDPAQAEAAITSRTKAIVPVHLYGQPADMVAFQAIAERRGVPILEDAAQSVLARCDAGMTSSIGLAGWLSFYPTKNLSAFGDAGLVTTNDDALAARMRQLRNHGSSERYHHELLGGNFRLDGLQAAVLRVKLGHLAGWTERRRALAARYDRLFREAAIDPARFAPLERVEAGHVYHQYVVQSPERDRLREHLQEARIASEIYYPIPLHLQPCFEGLGQRAGSLPISERAAREVLALPIDPTLSDAQIDRVVDAIARFFRA